MATDRLDGALYALVDIIHKRQPPNQDPQALLPEWFEALRRLFPFSSGVFMTIDPVGGTICQGSTHDCDQHDMRDYLTHYPPLDPTVIRKPALKNPGTVVRLSDVTDIGRTVRGGFGEFMNHCRKKKPRWCRDGNVAAETRVCRVEGEIR